MSLSDELYELASAYLDGETTAEETARVEADPDLMAEVEQLRSMHEAIAEPVTPPPAAVRAAAIAAALDASGTAENVTALGPKAAEEPRAVSPPASGDATVIRPSRWERFGRVGSVAAAAVAGIAVIGIVLSGLNSDSTTSTETATTAMDSSASTDDATDSFDSAEAFAADDEVSEAADLEGSGSSAGEAMEDATDDAGAMEAVMADDGAMEDDVEGQARLDETTATQSTDAAMEAESTLAAEAGTETVTDTAGTDDADDTEQEETAPEAFRLSGAQQAPVLLLPSYPTVDALIADVTDDVTTAWQLDGLALYADMPETECLLDSAAMDYLADAAPEGYWAYGVALVERVAPDDQPRDLLVIRTGVGTGDAESIVLIDTASCGVSSIHDL